MPLAWSIFLSWPTGRGKTKCFIWAVGLMTGSMAFCISDRKQYRQQRAAFWAGLCICRQHCAVNGINVGKIICCLCLPQFAVRHWISWFSFFTLQAFLTPQLLHVSFFICALNFATAFGCGLALYPLANVS